MPTVQRPPCPIPWCTSDTTDPLGHAHTEHAVRLATFERAEVLVDVELHQDGAGAPRVRVYVYTEQMEKLTFTGIPADAADELGRVIAALGTPMVFDFAAALTRAASLIAGEDA